MMNILNVEESILDDESITRYEFHTLLPYSSTSVNNNDEIRIPLHQQDILTLPCESRIYIEGTLKKVRKMPINMVMDFLIMQWLTFSEKSAMSFMVL